MPTSGAPPRYSWLGTKELPTELPSGITAMGARSYDPQLGRFLQPDPTPGGSADAYAYTYGNPLNETDPTGQWTLNQTSGGASAVGGTSEGTTLTGGTGIAANAITPPPVNTEIEAAFQANPPWDQATAGTEEYEEYWEEEWEEEGGYEEIGYHDGKEESQVDSAVLVQPLTNEEGGATTTLGAPVPLCEPGQKTPCARFAYRNGHHRSRPYNNGEKGSSRCAQYGGHWQGHTCVGVRSPGGAAGNSCRMIGGVTAPLAAASGPGGWVLWTIGFGACWLPN